MLEEEISTYRAKLEQVATVAGTGQQIPLLSPDLELLYLERAQQLYGRLKALQSLIGRLIAKQSKSQQQEASLPPVSSIAFDASSLEAKLSGDKLLEVATDRVDEMISMFWPVDEEVCAACARRPCLI